MSKESQKIVVRLLPPEITEDELLATIGENHRQAISWKNFVVGKRYKGEAKPSLNSRCYFQFESVERAEEFIKDYHGHAFVDGQGESFRAVACFAPYQKVPRQKPQRDPRDGTISEDSTYKAFLESLSEAKVYEAPPDPKVLLKPLDYGDTPLLNFLKHRSKERRARSERKERRRWRPEGEAIDEEAKRPKWRCAECGTSKHLEEDPDDRGTFYCTFCWESWESQQLPAAKAAKKKKKKHRDEREEEAAEAAEEPEDPGTKKKKKKRDKEPEGEWRAKEKPHAAGRGAEEEEAEGRRRKRRDGEAGGEGAEEGEGYSSKGRWRAKKHEAAEEGEEDWGPGPGREKHKSRSKGSHRESQDGWWEDDRQWRPARSEKAEKADDVRVARWRAKGPAAEDGGGEEKSKKNKKEKKADSGDGGYWRPKS